MHFDCIQDIPFSASHSIRVVCADPMHKRWADCKQGSHCHRSLCADLMSCRKAASKQIEHLNFLPEDIKEKEKNWMEIFFSCRYLKIS
jgi:hypothetical protein